MNSKKRQKVEETSEVGTSGLNASYLTPQLDYTRFLATHTINLHQALYHYEDDQLLVHRQMTRFKIPEYRCWRPKPSIPIALSNSHYIKLGKIERVLHYNDYKAGINGIVYDTILDESCSVIPKWTAGTWFGIASNNKKQSAFYGNVSCQVSFKKFIKTFNPKCYFPEVVQYTNHSAPRLLLTTQNVPKMDEATRYNPFVWGGPWFVDPSGEHWYLKDSRRFQNEGSNQSHELEIFVVLSGDEHTKLDQMCSVVAVNHDPKKCRGDRNDKREGQVCRSRESIERCQVLLDQLRKKKSKTQKADSESS